MDRPGLTDAENTDATPRRRRRRRGINNLSATNSLARGKYRDTPAVIKTRHSSRYRARDKAIVESAVIAFSSLYGGVAGRARAAVNHSVCIKY